MYAANIPQAIHAEAVMAGLDPAIHAATKCKQAQDFAGRLGVDARHKAGHDVRRLRAF